MASRTVTFISALALFAIPVQAQQGEAARLRLGGFWAGGGLGGASTGINCELCVGDRARGK